MQRKLFANLLNGETLNEQSFVEEDLNIAIVAEIEADCLKKFFGRLERRKQYYLTDILAELHIELADEIKLPNNMLVRLAQEDNKQALQDLCVKNIRLIMKYAKKYLDRQETCLTLDDLVHEGMLGLMTAAEKFVKKRNLPPTLNRSGNSRYRNDYACTSSYV